MLATMLEEQNVFWLHSVQMKYYMKHNYMSITITSGFPWSMGISVELKF